MARLDKRGRRIGDNWWRTYIVDSWSASNDLWLAQREKIAIGYETEEQEYAEIHPRPTLKRFMITLRFKQTLEREP